jgi:hypothetical protein
VAPSATVRLHLCRDVPSLAADVRRAGAKRSTSSRPPAVWPACTREATMSETACTRRPPTRSCALHGSDCNYKTGEQDILNPIGVNLIRAFPAAASALGARTIRYNGLWKYPQRPPSFITWRSPSAPTRMGRHSSPTARSLETREATIDDLPRYQRRDGAWPAPAPSRPTMSMSGPPP